MKSSEPPTCTIRPGVTRPVFAPTSETRVSPADTFSSNWRAIVRGVPWSDAPAEGTERTREACADAEPAAMHATSVVPASATTTRWQADAVSAAPHWTWM